MQNYLVFQTVSKYFKTPAISYTVIVWKSKGLSGESIKAPAASDDSLNPGKNYINNAKIQVKLNGSCFQAIKSKF